MTIPLQVYYNNLELVLILQLLCSHAAVNQAHPLHHLITTYSRNSWRVFTSSTQSPDTNPGHSTQHKGPPDGSKQVPAALFVCKHAQREMETSSQLR